MLLEEFEIRSSGIMQAFAFNIRRDKFKDRARAPRLQLRLRFRGNEQADFLRAIQAHQELFRRHSSSPRPVCRKARSSRSSKPCATRCRRSSSRRAYTNPVGGSPENTRNNLREAIRLMKEAGYEIRDRKLVNVKTNEPLTVEFLASDPNSERFFLFYKPSLERLGIDVTVRTVDDAQYENRLRQWDFDVITASWGQSLSPGNEQRGFWGSQAADQPGSRNLVGIKNRSGRCDDRARDLRQEPRGTGRRHQGARSRAALESLRRAAMDLRQSAHGALGPLRPSRDAAEIRHCRHSRRCGGGTRTRPRRPDRVREKDLAPQCADRSPPARQPDCHRARLPPGIAVAQDAGAPRHFRLRRSEISRRLSAFRLRQSERAEGRVVLADRPVAAIQPDLSSPSIRSTATSSRAMRRRAWS